MTDPIYPNVAAAGRALQKARRWRVGDKHKPHLSTIADQGTSDPNQPGYINHLESLAMAKTATTSKAAHQRLDAQTNQTFTIAEVAIAKRLAAHHYETIHHRTPTSKDDPTLILADPSQIGNALDGLTTHQPEHVLPALDLLISLSHTDLPARMLPHIKDPRTKGTVRAILSHIDQSFDEYTRVQNMDQTVTINTPYGRTNMPYQAFRSTLHLANQLSALITPPITEFNTDHNGWEPLNLAKPELNQLHPSARHKIRRTKPSLTGTRVKYPSRLLIDPQRKIMAQKVKVPGATVVLDASGSMSWTTDQLRQVLDAIPAATIWAYSAHGPERTNVWLLADKGMIVSKIPAFPGGNGVDVPALEHAARLTKGRAPKIWLTDGAVTGKRESQKRAHKISAYKAVADNNYHICPTLDQLLEAVAAKAKYSPHNATAFLGDEAHAAYTRNPEDTHDQIFDRYPD